MNVMELEALSS